MKETIIDDFAGRAADFCQFVEHAHELDSHERMKSAIRLLSALVGLAVDLPTGDADTPDVDDVISFPSTWPGFGEHDYYWMMFDPSVDEEPVVGSLNDDFLDIYLDLKRGLIAFERGDVGSAVWEWNFGFLNHWGQHATTALRALTHLFVGW